MENHKILTKMLRDARRAIGKEAVESLLPKPFKCWISDHDTGCQITIELRAEGLATIRVWEGSVWYNACYEFNDRNRVFGLNPETYFALPTIEKFFADVQRAYEDHETSRLMARTEQEINSDNHRAKSLNAYKDMVDSLSA